MRTPSSMRLLAAAAVLSLLAATTDAHGFVSQPRMRGALKCQRNVVPQVMDASAPIDYCPHCLNAGGEGRVSAAGPWAPYEPMKGNKRGGFGICGDPAGSDDHMKTGKFANPPSMPFVADYTGGGVANFEFDATANHGGYLEFYLCNVEKNPNQEIQFSSFAQDCHYLERVAHDSCESGNDKDCGPIDPEFPGRWVLPCRIRAGDQGDQIFGGENGKMAYRIPDGNIKVGVVHAYWATCNKCTPGPFLQKYKYPQAWAGCPGDGGSIGGKPQHAKTCQESGETPEEYWSCSDVTVGGGSGKVPTTVPKSGGTAGSVTQAPVGTVKPVVGDTSTPASTSPIVGATMKPVVGETPTPTSTYSQSNNVFAGNGKCAANWNSCEVGKTSCCDPSYTCCAARGSTCVPADDANKANAGKTDAQSTPSPVAKVKGTSSDVGGSCAPDGDYCAGKTCCSSNATCERVNNDGKNGDVCHVSSSSSGGNAMADNGASSQGNNGGQY